MNATIPESSRRRSLAAEWIVRVLLLLAFALLVGRFWHPYYGFTRFLQMDEPTLAAASPAVRAAGVYTDELPYDGQYYVQLAASPFLTDPTLPASIDTVSYRARRILLSWLAWLAGGGDATAAVRAYAWINLVVWAGLAAQLWRILPTGEWRNTAAWAGVLFCSGTMLSVRLALPDLLAVALLAATAWLIECRRPLSGAVLLGLAGLTRETVLLNAAVFLPGEPRRLRDWARALVPALVAFAPLALWLWFLSGHFGATSPGIRNFALPGSGWAGRWREVIRVLGQEPEHWLAAGMLLAHMALTVQFCHVFRRPAPADVWWRVAAINAALLLVLGGAVWEGEPGAATRVLLPLTLAFNVRAARTRAGWGWLAAGNLGVLGGVVALWLVPTHWHEPWSGRLASGGFVVRSDARWYEMESLGRQNWTWCANTAGIAIERWPAVDEQAEVRLLVRGAGEHRLKVSQDGRILWSGTIGTHHIWIKLPAVAFASGHAALELTSPDPPVAEQPDGGGRKLGFALYNVRTD